MTEQTYWDKYDDITKDESGGGGIVAKVLVETGYKAYIAGLDQASTFFPVSADDKAGRAVAKDECNKLGSRANWGIQIRAYREGAYSLDKPATWQDDRFFNTDGWTDACKEVVVPSLKETAIASVPWEGYARIGFKPDPFKQAMGEDGMTDTDQAGNPRFPQVAYIVETLTEEEYKAVGDNAGEPAQEPIPFEGPDVPKVWRNSRDGWMGQVAKIKAGVKNLDAPLPILQAEVEAVALALVKQYLKDDQEPTLEGGLGATVDEIVAWLPEVAGEGEVPL